MGRSPCCDKVGLKKGPWTPEEDQKLLAYIEEHGHGSWRALPAKAGLQRCGKSCRLRWTNYLRPDIKRGKFSIQEEQTIIQLHALLGNRWSAIATHLPRRTDNEIKNYWNTHLKKRLAKLGIDPVTHKPKTETLCSPEGQHKSTTASLSHMAQWESARLEAEARLARESKLRAPSSINLTTSTSGALQFQPQAGTFLVWPKSASGGQGQIDLESPTSTLSYSVSAESTVPPTITSIGLVDHHHRSAIFCHEAEEQQGEIEWKCFGRMTHMLDNNKDRHRVGALPSFSSVDTCTVFGEEEEEEQEQKESWMPESSSMMRSTTGFTEMLSLDRSNEQDSSEIGADSDNADGGSCMDEESYQAKCAGSSSNYWNSILDLVNSSSPSPPPATSPPPVF